MNNYKLRAWHKEGKQMLEASLDHWFRVISETGKNPYPAAEWMLCSPFTDINGKEICQGDRVRVEDLGEGEVVFEKGCFLFVEGGAKVGEQGFWCALCDPIDDGKKVEVIGTIYEPKEGI